MLRECKLLVWDESTMSHKKAIEALNRTLQDLRDSADIMGGMGFGTYAEMLKIGNGCLEVDAEGHISLSRESCNLVENDMDLIAHVFPELQQNLSCDQWLCARGILTPKNEIVFRINTDILKEVQGEMKGYLSMDTIMGMELSTSYPVEFLNSLELCRVYRHINFN
ncbi:ATP-dependent DNA helicase [Trichonephila clavipes]|nr:ATP-dependent DNA helicase [Trichonephila clavipes]